MKKFGTHLNELSWKKGISKKDMIHIFTYSHFFLFFSLFFFFFFFFFVEILYLLFLSLFFWVTFFFFLHFFLFQRKGVTLYLPHKTFQIFKICLYVAINVLHILLNRFWETNFSGYNVTYFVQISRKLTNTHASD